MEFKKARTIYDQIADLICENILRKRWREGDRIPSVREMAVEVEVNPNTVMRAYTSLQERDVIVNRRGMGYYVAENSRLRVQTMKRNEFIRDELPALVKTMDLLGISIDDLGAMIASCAGSQKEHDNEVER